MDLPASVANKRLTARLSSLDATPTKNRGWAYSVHSWSYLHTGMLPRLISFVCHSYENCRVCTQNSHSGTGRTPNVQRFNVQTLPRSNVPQSHCSRTPMVQQ
jgi:hypothetical protein